ncbi:MAG: histidine kinase [Flavobacterium sp.]|uniref:sensor histidine kinase n=1 Tax=Flavobacterium sp. TaxID=239 RepID=UPI00120CD696|nr:sensor histidine kinase [Flavobacterium sp.]RZJ67646.1 MAG: histidine kinase [Flavobacterium sp.]
MNNFLSKNRFVVPALHVLVWLVLFSLPYLLSSGQEFNLTRTIQHLWLPLVLYAILFYVNYVVLVDRLLIRKKVWPYVAVNLVVIIAFIYLRFLYRNWSGLEPGPEGNRTPPPLLFFIYFDALSLMIPMLFAIGLRIFERWILSESDRKETENARLTSELQHLKYQLQPHFFFNSLNNIYSLVDISPERAKQTIHSLGTLMRYLLYDTNIEFVSLRKEVDFMKQYVALMDLRTSDKTVVHTDFPLVSDAVKIAPLLFISLIENAFKHGVSATNHTEIFFKLSVVGSNVVFESTNGDFSKNYSDKSGSGIGLQNLKKRLELLYPNAHSFTFGTDGGHFSTRLEIELPNLKA